MTNPAWGTAAGSADFVAWVTKKLSDLEALARNGSVPSQFQNSSGQVLRYDWLPVNQFYGALRAPPLFNPADENQRTFFERDNKHSLQPTGGVYSAHIEFQYSIKKKTATERVVFVFGDRSDGTFWTAATGNGIYVTLTDQVAKLYKRVAGTNTLVATLATLTENATTDYVDFYCQIYGLNPVGVLVSVNGVYTSQTITLDMSAGGFLGLYEFGAGDETRYKPQGFAASVPGVGSVLGTKVIILTSGTTWTVPADFNAANNSIEAIGGGGSGAGGVANTRSGGGGGGGEYRRINNFSPGGATVAYVIGAAASDTTFNVTSLVAKAGANAAAGNGGAGGSGGTGADGNHNGGTGGNGRTGANDSGGAGGGGAGGTTAAGSNGAAGQAFGNGGNGGNGGAALGGAGGTGPGAPGAPGTVWLSNPGGVQAGAGGGGGGGAGVGGAGGLYGSGGAGGGADTVTGYAGAAGKQGVIVITYTP